ncbi:MAG: carbohydrate-binding protein [Bacteroidales bacterium]|nr:carbohydrate-binding protein [Bacteroidales bacterium]
METLTEAGLPVDITSPGAHVLNIWMREDGSNIDKIVVTTNASYVPSGNGPSESPRGGGVIIVVPVAPSSLTANAVSASEINIDWADNANNEDGYVIEAHSGSNAFAMIDTVAADVTSFAHTNLEPSTSYTYRVFAFNTIGNSSYSNQAVAITEAVIIVGNGLYEAEHYTSQSGNTVFEHLDASNDQAVDFGGNGAWIEWNNVNQGEGLATMTFRYYNGSSSNRPCLLHVNGVAVSTVDFVPSGGWATAGFVTATANLNAGNNTVRLTVSSGNGGPNVDKMDVEVGGSLPIPPAALTR